MLLSTSVRGSCVNATSLKSHHVFFVRVRYLMYKQPISKPGNQTVKCGWCLSAACVVCVTFPVACWSAELCEVEVFIFSVLQFTEQGVLSVFALRTKLLMEKIAHCEADAATPTDILPQCAHKHTHR